MLLLSTLVIWICLLLSSTCFEACVNTLRMKRAAFGCGCFWGPQREFDKLKGVNRALVGYMGGTNENPTYQSVCQGDGHIESILIEYNDEEIKYEELLDVFWKQELVRDAGQYSAHIFTLNEEQKNLAKASIQTLIDKGETKRANIPVIRNVDEDADIDTFFVAESYHQNYLDKNRYVPIILGSAFVVNILPRDIGVPLELYKASATMTIMYIIYTLGQRYVFGKNVENINLLR